HRTDVYSLGATLYELLTLHPAVDGASKHEVLHRLAFEAPAAPRKFDRSIPTELETVALKALAKDPQERYATAAELADHLPRAHAPGRGPPGASAPAPRAAPRPGPPGGGPAGSRRAGGGCPRPPGSGPAGTARSWPSWGPSCSCSWPGSASDRSRTASARASWP